MTETEVKRYTTDIPKKEIELERIWNKGPNIFTIKIPITETVGELVILEFKRMSCVTDQYVKRARNKSQPPNTRHKVITRTNT